MGIVSIACNVHMHIIDMSTHDCETIYRKSLKKIISFLYIHPKIRFSFYFSGPFIEWISKSHSEFIKLLSELISRKQVELLGGGYYEPLFSIITPVDRVGQIELNTTCLRTEVGKKPHGIFLGNSVWDPSFISSFKSCGMEYALVDNSIIPTHSNNTNIFLTENMGKTITLIPIQENNICSKKLSPEKVLNSLINYASDTKTNSKKLYFTSFSIDECIELIENKWFTEFCSLAETSVNVEFSTPSTYLKNNQTDYVRMLIPECCPKNISQWATKPYIAVQNNQNQPNIRNFLYTYQETQYLYARFMYVTLLVSQSKGDRLRKKNAKETLWKAQQTNSYCYQGDTGISINELRQNTYKTLLTVEKLVRETTLSLADCAVSFDYDMDGKKEYIIHQNDYNAFISLSSGMIFELDILANTKNYCDTTKRISEFDNIIDNYPKKMFLDHIIDYDSFEQFTNDMSNSSGIFTQINYTEIQFDRIRKEIELHASALFGEMQQEVLLVKKYAFSRNGIQVQYILKNNSPLPLQCYFATESNLNLSGTSDEQQLIEIISKETKEISCPNQIYIRQDGVSLVQFTDIQAKNVFVFEPNENSGIVIQPLFITRPINGNLEKQYQATTSAFFWKMNLSPSYEFEKTLFLGICPSKKNRESKNKKTKQTLC